jgi:hypothetical protein
MRHVISLQCLRGLTGTAPSVSPTRRRRRRRGLQVSQSAQRLCWVPLPSAAKGRLLLGDRPTEETDVEERRSLLYQLSPCTATSTTPSRGTIGTRVETRTRDHQSTTEEEERASWIRLLQRATVSMFLPRGYPSSVTPDYLPFTLFQFAQSVSGTMAGTVSTQVSPHVFIRVKKSLKYVLRPCCMPWDWGQGPPSV